MNNIKTLLDSGAFSADQQGTVVDVYAYIDYIKETNPEIYFNLDVIGDVDGTWKNQEIMETAGLSPLPVYHADDPIYFLNQCTLHYEYFALGGMAGGVSEQTRQRFLDSCWEIICDTDDRMPCAKVHGLGLASPLLVARYPWYCMTEEDHTVLTKTGWKQRKELSIGTEILCFDRGNSIWQKVEEIPVFPVENVEINHMYNRNFNSYTSDNHRWNIYSRGKKYIWKTQSEFSSNDTIPRIGYYTFPTKKIYTDEQISLLAWFWTDGTIKGRSKYKNDSVVIYQSSSANKEKCDTIKQLLDDCNEAYCISGPSGASHVLAYELYGNMAKWLLRIAPGKNLPVNLPLQLTEKQTKLFVKYSVQADGYTGQLVRRNSFGISVKRPYKIKNLEVLRTMCLLSGIPTSIRESNGYKTLTSSSVNKIYVSNLNSEKVKYSGNLWCVRVKSGAFYTKCNDKIYVTGNSIDTASGIHYGRYGIIIIPKMDRKGHPDYQQPPYTLYVTERSTAQKVENKHIKTVSSDLRSWIYQYIQNRGFDVGSTVVEEVLPDYQLNDNEKFTDRHHTHIERVESEGVFSNGIIRDYFNIDFYMKLEDSLPEWPWAYKPTVRSLF